MVERPKSLVVGCTDEVRFPEFFLQFLEGSEILGLLDIEGIEYSNPAIDGAVEHKLRFLFIERARLDGGDYLSDVEHHQGLELVAVGELVVPARRIGGRLELHLHFFISDHLL